MANAAAYARVAAKHDDIRALADTPEMLSLRHQTLARLAVRRRSRLAIAPLVVAAFAMLIAGLGAYEYYRPSAAPSRLATADSDIGGAQVFQTAIGQRTMLTLGDGSRVMLNSSSRVQVAYTRRERRLTLIDGQAWFEVARHQPRPFVVYAGGLRVEAHGTAFDVRIMKGLTEVMLAEGKVTVASQRGAGGDARIGMNPRQLVIASATGMTVRQVDPDAWRNWREGVVRLDNIPLSQAVAEMNRYSKTRLQVANEATGKIAISGAFHAGATTAFLEALEMGFHVHGRKTAEETIVLTKAQ
ncbi:FecR domain-containing protein [Sphingobium sp. AN641]|uniref:FecR family protein n=1 Tax=Sphingobium sp. AN641 TaxID=3133443 RepID=UPI0030C23A34